MRRFIPRIVLALGFVLPLSAPAATRAVSLRVLAHELSRCRLGRTCTPAVERLGGLATLDGFVVDRRHGDVVLYGASEPVGAPALRTDDLLVALRSAFRRYVARVDGRLVWSPLGCSIDPNPRVLAELRRTMAGRSLDAALARWGKVCAQAQRVVVTGMPHRVHFARVLVVADYDLKRLVNGSDRLDLPGFESLSDLQLQAIRTAQGRGEEPPSALLNRFWFTIGHAGLTIDGDAVGLDHLAVRLMTEEQLLGPGGALVGTQRAAALPEAFAERFTAQWDAIAARRPIYAEMAALFRLAVVAQAIADERAFERSGLVPDVLLEAAAIPDADVERTLPGRSHVVGFDVTERTGGVVRTRTVRLPSCGGVDLTVDLAQADVRREPSPALASLVARVLAGRPAADVLAWLVGAHRQDALVGG
jgi:hypothetical protein